MNQTKITPKSIAVPQLVDKNTLAENMRRLEEVSNDMTYEFKKALSGQQCLEMASRIFGSSPYLSELIIRNPATFATLWSGNPDSLLADKNYVVPEDQSAVMSLLRQEREKAILTIACMDISGLWDTKKATHHWSLFADWTVEIALSWCVSQLYKKGFFTRDNSKDSGIFVLGMGKLGATELNYSSDIDLILFYDPQKLPLADIDAGLSPLLKQTQQMINVLESRTADGYVFRTDIRLRPDPFSTPIIMSVPAGISYYESVGQNWERAAYIRARVIAGDIATGESFLKELRPFIWRKHLDFAAISDIQSIKRQIDSSHANLSDNLFGHDVKLGAGGIRDIELFTHTLQLIWGGRKPELRERITGNALKKLAEFEIIPTDHAEILERNYWRLRKIEHAIQLINDEHTHSLPQDENGFNNVACLLGYDDIASFTTEVKSILAEVSAICRPLFEENKPLSSSRGNDSEEERHNLVFTGNEDDPETTNTLSNLGYKEPQTISRCIRQWHSGTCRATRSAKAREILTELIPDIIDSFAATPEPDYAFRQLDRFFYSLPAGVQTLSTLAANINLIDLLANIFSSSPVMSELLCDYPHVIDRFLSSGIQENKFSAAEIRKEIKSILPLARDNEEKLQMLRQLDNEYQFLVAMKLLAGEYDSQTSASSFTSIADALIEAVFALVTDEMQKQYGKPDNGETAILALGKWGNGNLTLDSDLDFILVYNAAGAGKCKLMPEVYYNKFAQRLITAISARMKFGKLYSVDMRLRPFGNDGPPATNFCGMLPYYEEKAWSYEFMALTNARTICGDNKLMKDITGMVADLTAKPPKTQEQLKADAADLIRQTRMSLPPLSIWDVKRQQGGLLELEMAAQIEILSGRKISDKHSGLIELMLEVQQLLRICIKDDTNTPAITANVMKLLTKSLGGAPDDRLVKAYESGYEIVKKILEI